MISSFICLNVAALMFDYFQNDILLMSMPADRVAGFTSGYQRQ
jgi:hypothetical protein